MDDMLFSVNVLQKSQQRSGLLERCLRTINKARCVTNLFWKQCGFALDALLLN